MRVVLRVDATPPGVVVTPSVQGANGTFWVNASYTFPSPGAYVVVLHVVDLFYDVQIATTNVYVSPGVAPALGAQLVSTPAYAGSSLLFEGTATGGSGQYVWNWSFGDGNFSSAANPSHLFAISGAYTVVVRVNDTVTDGVNTTVLAVTVFALPVLFVSVTAGPNGSLSYDFHASVGGGSGVATVVWAFGDGSVGRGVSVSHDYRAIGTYAINVSATDPAGRAGSTQFNLTAYAGPSAGSSGPSGFTEVDVVLLVAAAGFGLLAFLQALRRGRAGPPSGRESDEDGEVSLT